MVQLHGDEGPAFCREAARRTGCKVIKALRVRSTADVQAAEAYRTDFHLLDAHRPGQRRGHRGELRLGAARRPALGGAADPRRRADARQRRRGDRGRATVCGRRGERGRGEPGRQGPRADGGVRRAGPRRALRGPSVADRRRARAGAMTAAGGGGDRGALRPVRRPLRPRGADPGARRAHGRLGRGARRPRVPGRARPRCCATSSGGRRRSTAPSGFRAGRPPRLPEARGPRPHRRPQDQQRGRPGAARQADGQAAGDRRDGRRPARGRDGDRLRAARASSASSTWAPRTCAARRRTSSGCGCWAPSVAPVEAGARTLKEAVSAAIRDWVTNVRTTHYIIGSAVGPAPYPALVRDLQRVIGDEAREQALAAEGALPGAGDRLRRRRLERDRNLLRRSSTTRTSS